ncbi:hypothetical protein C8T65DRAFT_683205, partial [Cerioporus squamosus]
MSAGSAGHLSIAQLFSPLHTRLSVCVTVSPSSTYSFVPLCSHIGRVAVPASSPDISSVSTLHVPSPVPCSATHSVLPRLAPTPDCPGPVFYARYTRIESS